MLPVLEAVVQTGKPLLIIAEGHRGRGARDPGRGRKARRVLVTLAECKRYLATLTDQQEEEANGDETGASRPLANAAVGRRGRGSMPSK